MAIRTVGRRMYFSSVPVASRRKLSASAMVTSGRGRRCSVLLYNWPPPPGPTVVPPRCLSRCLVCPPNGFNGAGTRQRIFNWYTRTRARWRRAASGGGM